MYTVFLTPFTGLCIWKIVYVNSNMKRKYKQLCLFSNPLKIMIVNGPAVLELNLDFSPRVPAN